MATCAPIGTDNMTISHRNWEHFIHIHTSTMMPCVNIEVNSTNSYSMDGLNSTIDFYFVLSLDKEISNKVMNIINQIHGLVRCDECNKRLLKIVSYVDDRGMTPFTMDDRIPLFKELEMALIERAELLCSVENPTEYVKSIMFVDRCPMFDLMYMGKGGIARNEDSEGNVIPFRHFTIYPQMSEHRHWIHSDSEFTEPDENPEEKKNEIKLNCPPFHEEYQHDSYHGISFNYGSDELYDENEVERSPIQGRMIRSFNHYNNILWGFVERLCSPGHQDRVREFFAEIPEQYTVRYVGALNWYLGVFPDDIQNYTPMQRLVTITRAILVGGDPLPALYGQMNGNFLSYLDLDNRIGVFIDRNSDEKYRQLTTSVKPGQLRLALDVLPSPCHYLMTMKEWAVYFGGVYYPNTHPIAIRESNIKTADVINMSALEVLTVYGPNARISVNTQNRDAVFAVRSNLCNVIGPSGTKLTKHEFLVAKYVNTTVERFDLSTNSFEPVSGILPVGDRMDLTGNIPNGLMFALKNANVKQIYDRYNVDMCGLVSHLNGEYQKTLGRTFQNFSNEYRVRIPLNSDTTDYALGVSFGMTMVGGCEFNQPIQLLVHTDDGYQRVNITHFGYSEERCSNYQYPLSDVMTEAIAMYATAITDEVVAEATAVTDAETTTIEATTVEAVEAVEVTVS